MLLRANNDRGLRSCGDEPNLDGRWEIPHSNHQRERRCRPRRRMPNWHLSARLIFAVPQADSRGRIRRRVSECEHRTQSTIPDNWYQRLRAFDLHSLSVVHLPFQPRHGTDNRIYSVEVVIRCPVFAPLIRNMTKSTGGWTLTGGDCACTAIQAAFTVS